MGRGEWIAKLAKAALLAVAISALAYFATRDFRDYELATKAKPLVDRYAEAAQRCFDTYSAIEFSKNPDCNAAMDAKTRLFMVIPYRNRDIAFKFNSASIMMRNSYIGSFRQDGCAKRCMEISVAAL